MREKIVVLTVVLLTIVLSGCAEFLHPEREKFVGSWSGYQGQTAINIDFFSDGTFIVSVSWVISSSLEGMYEIRDEKLVLDLGDGYAISYNYEFRNIHGENNCLELISGVDQNIILYRA